MDNNFNNMNKIISYPIIAGYVFRKRAVERNKPYFIKTPLSLYRQQFTQLYKSIKKEPN